MTLKEAIKISEQHGTALPPPTQLAPYQQLAYMYKYWSGKRSEYEPKVDYIDDEDEDEKDDEDEDEKEDSGHKLTIEQYNVQRTRSVLPNYLVRSLTPFFYMQGIKDKEDFEQKKDYIYNKKPGKRKKKKNEEA